MKTARNIIAAARDLEPLERQKGIITSFTVEMPGTYFTLNGGKAVITNEEGEELLLPDKCRQQILATIKESVGEFYAELDRDVHKILEQFEEKPADLQIRLDMPPGYEHCLKTGYVLAKRRQKLGRVQRQSYNVHGHHIYVKLSQEKGVPSVAWLYDNNKIKWELIIGDGEEQE